MILIYLYHNAVKNIPSINILHVTQAKYIDAKKFLVSLLSKSLTIKGTKKLHWFIVVALVQQKLKLKYFLMHLY